MMAMTMRQWRSPIMHQRSRFKLRYWLLRLAAVININVMCYRVYSLMGETSEKKERGHSSECLNQFSFTRKDAGHTKRHVLTLKPSHLRAIVSSGTTPPPGPCALNDRARRLSGPTTPTRAGSLRSIHPPSWLAKAADLELPPGHHLAERATAQPAAHIDHGLRRSQAVMSEPGQGRAQGWMFRVRGVDWYGG